jgi:hypothetical protein
MKIYLIQWRAVRRGVARGTAHFLTKDEDFVSVESDLKHWNEVEVYFSPEEAEKDFRDPGGEYLLYELDL